MSGMTLKWAEYTLLHRPLFQLDSYIAAAFQVRAAVKLALSKVRNVYYVLMLSQAFF